MFETLSALPSASLRLLLLLNFLELCVPVDLVVVVLQRGLPLLLLLYRRILVRTAIARLLATAGLLAITGLIPVAVSVTSGPIFCFLKI